MSSTTHTPGPWATVLSERVPGWYQIVDPLAGNSQIADVICEERYARLIAAAPELLEALKAAHSTYRTFRNVPKDEQGWTSLDDDAIAMMEQAIAKAEGR